MCVNENCIEGKFYSHKFDSAFSAAIPQPLFTFILIPCFYASLASLNEGLCFSFQLS